MPTQVQLRRGTTTEHSTFTGAVGEVTVDTNKKTVVVHDGSTAGGVPLLRQDYSNSTTQLAGMRNKIINGKMEIAQRGTSFGAITNAAYFVDRWRANNSSSAVLTAAQLDGNGGEFNFSAGLTVTTVDTSIAAGDAVSIEQPIEGYHIYDLIGRTFTISFWVYSTRTGTHCISLANSSGGRSYVATYTVNAANTWEYKTITITGGLITAGTWDYTNGVGLVVRFALAAGSTFQTTAGAWQTGNFLATANQVNCLDTVGNIFAITGVQLEVGSVATPFEHRPYGTELALCQRYYVRDTRQFVAPQTRTAGVDRASFSFPVPMRSTPTVTTTVSSGGGSLVIEHGGPLGFTAGSNAASSATILDGYTAAIEL